MIRPGVQVAMPDLLTQLGREFHSLAMEIEQLQSTVSHLLAQVALTPELVEQAQALDHVFQHMSQLGSVMERVSLQASPEWTLCARTALAGVSLSALASRLAGTDHEAARSGEFEMF